MRRIFLATVSCLALTGAACAEGIKIGVEMGFTGPMKTLTPPMARAAELAIAEVNASGVFLGETKVSSVVGDDTCIDPNAAIAMAHHLVATEKVSGIIGPTCSGAAEAVLRQVAVPSETMLISPSVKLASVGGDGLVFSLAPPDAQEGDILAQIMAARGVKSVAIIYTDDDYGREIAAAIKAAFTRRGGKVTLSLPHARDKADHASEVGALADAGGDAIVVAGYADQGGADIVRSLLDSGRFSKFVFPTGMWSADMLKTLGKRIDGAFGDLPGNDSPSASMLQQLTRAAGIEDDAVFVPQSYDAAALMLLAMQAATSPVSAEYKTKIAEIAEGPGEKIYPGELAKGLRLLKDGRRIQYVGAADFHLAGKDGGGAYREVEAKDGVARTVRFR